MPRNREVVKGFIELAQSVEEADNILSQEFSTIEEKYAYIQGMFDFSIIGAHKKDMKIDYQAALSAIINQKWRA